MILENTNDPKGLLYAKCDIDKNIIMGIYPVMYGYRIRAGYYNLNFYELDWCAGNEIEHINILYSMCYYCLSKRSVNDPFINLPATSIRKPYYNDEDFLLKIKNDLKDITFSVLNPTILLSDLVKLKIDNY